MQWCRSSADPRRKPHAIFVSTCEQRSGPEKGPLCFLGCDAGDARPSKENRPYFNDVLRLSKSSLAEFLSRRPFSVVHVDANWDGYQKAVADKLHGIESEFEQSVSFGYMDCDEEQAYAMEIGIINVPSIAYYRGTNLVGVVIGTQQDVAANISRLMLGQTLDSTNLLSRS